MLQEHYINSTDLCSVDMTNKLLTLGMGSEMLYYDEEDKMYHFPLWQAQKWLREEKHINVRVNYLPDGVWFADWLNLDTEEYDDSDCKCATYEKALEDGIETVLLLLDN